MLPVADANQCHCCILLLFNCADCHHLFLFWDLHTVFNAISTATLALTSSGCWPAPHSDTMLLSNSCKHNAALVCDAIACGILWQCAMFPMILCRARQNVDAVVDCISFATHAEAAGAIAQVCCCFSFLFVASRPDVTACLIFHQTHTSL